MSDASRLPFSPARNAREAVENLIHRFWNENEDLRRRVIELEAELALLRGTPGSSPTSETLTEYTHDVPPDAPR
jgi:hypothetical protein